MVSITWKPNTDADPLQKVADILQEGKYADGITLLELFLSDDPTNTTILFNLGRAYSDQGQWDRSIELLRKLKERAAAHERTRRAERGFVTGKQNRKGGSTNCKRRSHKNQRMCGRSIIWVSD